MVSVHKKKDPTDKCNYGSVSILPHLSKVFEKIMFDQLYIYMNNLLNELFVDFEKLIEHNMLFLNCSKYGKRN